MNKKLIRNTDLSVSEIVLGSDYYGSTLDTKTAGKFMDMYFSQGGNTIDTARLYSGGKSEEIVGDFVKTFRDKVIISTKCAHPPLENMAKSRLSKEEIESDVDSSLKALKTDYIDILWLHRDDVTLPVYPIADALISLVKKGKIRCFGASNWSGERMAMLNEYASTKQSSGFVGGQIQWSAAKCRPGFDPTLIKMNDEEYAFYKESGLPVFAFSAQAKGFFEKYDKNCLSEKTKDRYLSDINVKTYEKIKVLSEKTGYSISQIALSYLLRNPDIDAFPIINASNEDQLIDSLGAVNIKDYLF